MRFPSSTVAVWLSAAALTAATVSAFTVSPAFVGRSIATTKSATVSVTHKAGCTCPACTGIHPRGCACASCRSASHPASCTCMACAARVQTRLFADTTETAEEAAVAEEEQPGVEAAAAAEPEGQAAVEEAVVAEEEQPEVEAAAEDEEEEEAEPEDPDAIPAEIEAMDGIENRDEAHNAERNYRGSLKKHKRGPKGTPLSELEVGAQVEGKVRKIASYGAFVDIGAQSDGLLHISRMAEGFVKDVNDVLKEGEAVDVRIAAVDTDKGQISLSMITEEAEARAKEAQQQQQPRQQRGGGGRRDYGPVLAALQEKGWDTDQFVEGTVERTLDFGAFVKIDSSLLNSEVEGDMDGLVHISALSVGRTNAVTDVVNPGDKVQVRVKGIADGKVSLSMISAEDEKPRGGRGSGREPVFEGAKDWKESLEKMQSEMPTFRNLPLIIDNRKTEEAEPVAEEVA